MKKISDKKKILVTGAGGMVGQATVAYLIKSGFFVRAFAHTPGCYFPPHKNLEMYIGDITKFSDIQKITKGVDICINLVARKLDEPDSYQVNVLGTKYLVEACERHKVGKFIHLSTLVTKIEDKGIYAHTKTLADEIIIRSKLSYVILKPGIIYGDPNLGVFAKLVRYSKLPVIPIIGDGSQQVNPIHVDDLAKILEKTTASQKLLRQIFDVGGTEEVTLKQFLLLIRSHFHQKKSTPPFLHLPISLGNLLVRTLTLILKNPPITASNIKGSTQTIDSEPGILLKKLGFKPRSLTAGLKQTTREFDNQYQLAKILLKYAGSGFNQKYEPTKEDIRTLLKKLPSKFNKDILITTAIRFPCTIGFLDSFTKIVLSKNNFQKYLGVAVALAECHPTSAISLLPRRRSWPQIVWQFGRIMIKSSYFFIGGLFIYFLVKVILPNEQKI